MNCPLCNGPTEEHEAYRDRACPACGLSAPPDVLERIAKMQAALVDIDAIRNDIIGRQTIGWSSHVYPLVAALGDAGFPGEGYDVARAKAVTLITEVKRLEAELAQLKQPASDGDSTTRAVMNALAEQAVKLRASQAVMRAIEDARYELLAAKLTGGRDG